MEFEDRIKDAMDKAGIHIVGDIDWSSREFQRFQMQNHWNRRKPLFLILFGTGASFGDWRDSSTWRTIWEKSFAEMSNEEKLERKRHFDKLQIEKSIRRSDAIYRAHLMLNHRSHHGPTCKPASYHHPYVLIKKVIPYSAFQIRSYLILPITDVNRCLISLQYIKSNGFKQFKKHATPKGGMLFIGGEITKNTILRICEGWATGCSIYTAINGVIVVAFGASNLKSVAVALRIKYPFNRIVICADNDRFNKENTGKLYGYEAAKVSGANIVYPDFSAILTENIGTDWNDLFNLSGIEEVKKQLRGF